MDLTRKDFLKAMGTGLATATGLSTMGAQGAPDTQRPNIVFLFSDQQRWDTVGAYGQPLPLTPNLDRMAREGVLFERAFTCQPVCGPARASLQTGRYASEVGCFCNNRMLPLDAPTIAKALSHRGYEVGYIGKWHLASQGPADGPDSFMTRAVPLERRGGYTDYWLASDVLEFTSHSYDGHMFDAEGHVREFPEGRYRADAVTDWAVEYLGTRRGDRPFFLFVSYIEPHHQNDHNQFEGPHGSRERWKDFVVPADLEGAAGNWREQYPDYLGCINSLDGNVGRVRARLDELGLSENTLVIYTTDHGCHFRTRIGEYKRTCHDASIRIPMIACGPGFGGGQRPDSLVSLIDLPPTLLEAAGATPLPDMRGRPLQPLAGGQRPGDWRREAFVELSEAELGRALRTDRWTYAVVAPGLNGIAEARAEQYVEAYLYDNDQDPIQRTNLVAEPSLADVRRELAERMRPYLLLTGHTSPQILPAPGS